MAEFLVELWDFLKERKKFWLLPIVIFLLFLGTLIVLTEGSAVAPLSIRCFKRHASYLRLLCPRDKLFPLYRILVCCQVGMADHSLS